MDAKSSLNVRRKIVVLATQLLAAAAVLSWGRAALAREPELDRARSIELARAAPEARATEAQVAVSRAALGAAGGLSLENPVLSGAGGVRFNPDGSRLFAGTATFSWPIDLGRKPSRRVQAAQADHREARASGDATERRFLLAVLMTHVDALKAERAIRIAEARRANSERLLTSAQRRHVAGSVSRVDVALATLQLGREAAATSTARGERDALLLRLQALLGLSPPAPLKVTGPLVPPNDVPALDGLLHALDRRTDVRAAAARVDAALARVERARAEAAPTLSVMAQYERDDGANIGTLGLAIPLPLLNTNQVEKATSTAEVNAARAQLDAARAGATADIRELYSRYEATRHARDALAPTAAVVQEAVSLAVRSYELGESDLAAALLVQREALEAERALLETEHAHAVAKIELLVAAGRVPQ